MIAIDSKLRAKLVENYHNFLANDETRETAGNIYDNPELLGEVK